ncbi:hypothetical protein B0T22DRAFT_197021 [Podospora appendiculata]|uniref:Uncharacterized protein n=1 Tax=Podospora appendiculata TaxID=314037 RepID=A0AAE0X3V1_9PEZI|nr:hypothetical protein B0T22DRAFT_197021 [Podospora appendiculata]
MKVSSKSRYVDPTKVLLQQDGDFSETGASDVRVCCGRARIELLNDARARKAASFCRHNSRSLRPGPACRWFGRAPIVPDGERSNAPGQYGKLRQGSSDRYLVLLRFQVRAGECNLPWMQTSKAAAHLHRRRESVCFRGHDGLAATLCWRARLNGVRAGRSTACPTDLPPCHSVLKSRLQTEPAPGKSEPYLSVAEKAAMKDTCMCPVGCRVFALACAPRGAQDPRAFSLENHGTLEARVQPTKKMQRSAQTWKPALP